MARRKTEFQWVRDDEDASDDDSVEEEAYVRPARVRQERARLQQLAADLAALSASDRATLPFGEELLEAVAQLAAAGPKPDRRRKALRVQRLLRAEDLDRVDAAMAGDTPTNRHLRATDRWRTRLVEGDDTDVEAYVDAHGSVDVQRLRQLVREARKPGAKGSKASKRLFQLLKATDAPEEG